MQQQLANTKDQRRQTTTFLAHHRLHVLVAEDDMMAQALWEKILRRIDPQVSITWATSAEGADRLIRRHRLEAHEFDFIIADVVLSGVKSGADLWRDHGRSVVPFLFASAVTPQALNAELGADAENCPPFMVRKPLDARECVETVKAMIAFRDVFAKRGPLVGT